MKKPTLDRIPDDRLVAALDVSSTVTGWAVVRRVRGANVVDDFGAIAPPKHWDADKRIGYMLDHLTDRAITRRTPPIRVAMERQSHLRAAGLRNANGLAVLGRAQGSVWTWLVAMGLQVDSVSEREWTRHQKKEKRAELLRLTCVEYRKAVDDDPDLDPGLDIADAIGIGFWRLDWKGE